MHRSATALLMSTSATLNNLFNVLYPYIAMLLLLPRYIYNSIVIHIIISFDPILCTALFYCHSIIIWCMKMAQRLRFPILYSIQ